MGVFQEADMHRIGPLVLAFVVFAATAFSQSATVTKPVNVRPTPSTSQSPLALLPPGAELDLVEAAPSGGFYHVRMPDGSEGWVWRRNVRLVSPRAVPPLPTGGCPPVGSHLVNGTPTPFPPDGDEGLRNIAKRSIPQGDIAVTLTFDDFRRLQADTDAKLGDARTKQAKIEPTRNALRNLPTTSGTVSEGDLVQLSGFVLNAARAGAEASNCGGADGFDFHVPVGATADTSEFQGVVVEMIPQGRPAAWTTAALKQIHSLRLPVLIVGGLTYDNEHLLNDNPQAPKGGEPKRMSLWEIHPVTRFLVCESADGCDPAAPTQWTPLEVWVKTHTH